MHGLPKYLCDRIKIAICAVFGSCPVDIGNWYQGATPHCQKEPWSTGEIQYVKPLKTAVLSTWQVLLLSVALCDRVGRVQRVVAAR